MRVPGCTMEMLIAVMAAADSPDRKEAASRLGVSISALDKRLKAASAILGARLFHYASGRVHLTEEGRVFYSAAAKSIEFALLAEESTRAHVLLKQNHLLIGHSAYLAPRILAMIHRLELTDHSGVHLNHKAGLTTSIVQRVTEGALHAGFGFLPLTAPELLIWKIFEEPLQVCLPEKHLMVSRAVIQREDLQDLQVIAVAREAIPEFHQEIERYLGSSESG